MQPQTGNNRFAKSALAGFLAILLLLSSIVAVTHSVHQTFHQEGKPSHLCLLCAFAHGQINAAEASLVVAVLILGCLLATLPDLSFSELIADYRLSPCRA